MEIITAIGSLISFKITPELIVLCWIGWMLHKRMENLEDSLEATEKDVIGLKVHTGYKNAA
jgi:hypothetical protein